MQLGASVVAVDAEGLTPALACAPNPAVAKCLATILAAHGMVMILMEEKKDLIIIIEYYVIIGQNWEAGQHSPSIQETSEVYLNTKNCMDSEHNSDPEKTLRNFTLKSSPISRSKCQLDEPQH